MDGLVKRIENLNENLVKYQEEYYESEDYKNDVFKVGDKIKAEIVGVNDVMCIIKLGNDVIPVDKRLLNGVEKIKEKKKDGENEDKNKIDVLNRYIECPYSQGLHCSIYLKKGCKECGMNR